MMEDRIPLPTDNIYKFYALFGLLLAIFGTGATVYVHQSTNDLVYGIVVEYETLNADPVRSISEEARFQLLKRKLEVAGQDKKVFLYALGIGIGVGILMMWYGFRKWHTEVQPVQDEIARLSLKKLRRDVGEEEDT